MAELNIKKIISNYLKEHFDMVTDINYDEVAATFVDKGGYDSNLSFRQNMNELIKTMGIGKANGKFNK